MKSKIALLILTTTSLVYNAERGPSIPYISGDTFRSIADVIFDETTQKIKPKKIKYGDIIFVRTDNLSDFFKYHHPRIKSRYILITHNSDIPIPNNYTGDYAYYLDDNKIIAWFGQNVENYAHPKLHAIPIGLANRKWPHGNISIFNAAMQHNRAPNERQHLLYMNMCIETYPKERRIVFDLFSQQSYCFTSPMKDLASYLYDLGNAKFTLSPRGNGLDCHKTWEALLMGSIPIIKHSSCDSLYDGLPVLLIHDWNEITEEFLHKKYEEFKNTTYHYERMYADYWINLIKEKSHS